jgi:hypothetical protein
MLEEICHHLQSHAYTKDRNLAGEMSDSIPAHAGIGGGMAWPGTNNELCWVFLDQFLHSDLVISEDVNGSSLENEILVNVPSERIVIVDEDDV